MRCLVGLVALVHGFSRDWSFTPDQRFLENPRTAVGAKLRVERPTGYGYASIGDELHPAYTRIILRKWNCHVTLCYN